jgi:ribonuclease Z
MLVQIKRALTMMLVVVVAIVLTTLGASTDKVHAKDNVQLGRAPVEIVDGQYPASYFPDTEQLRNNKMKIIALGTGMPNQTPAVVSISYLVELGNGDKLIFDIGSGALPEQGVQLVIASHCGG